MLGANWKWLVSRETSPQRRRLPVHMSTSRDVQRSKVLEMKRFLLFFIPLLVASNICVQAVHAAPPETPSAQSPPNLGAKPYGSHLEPILKTINASPDQREKITAVVTEFRPKIEPSLVKYREKRDAFLQAMITGKASEDIMSKQDEMNQLSSFITSQYMVMNLKVRKLLKPEQMEPYENYRKKQGWVRH